MLLLLLHTLIKVTQVLLNVVHSLIQTFAVQVKGLLSLFAEVGLDAKLALHAFLVLFAFPLKLIEVLFVFIKRQDVVV